MGESRQAGGTDRVERKLEARVGSNLAAWHRQGLPHLCLSLAGPQDDGDRSTQGCFFATEYKQSHTKVVMPRSLEQSDINEVLSISCSTGSEPPGAKPGGVSWRVGGSEEVKVASWKDLITFWAIHIRAG